MLTPTAVLAELAKIKPFYGKQAPDLDAQLGAIYADVLNQAGVTTQAELNLAVRMHLADPKAGEFWPKPANLIGTARHKLAIEAAVGAAVQRLDTQELTTYHPETGTRWDHRLIQQKLGRSALEAFVESGGTQAWGGHSKSQEWATRTFSEAYRRKLEAEAQAGVLDVAALPAPPVPVKLLPPSPPPPPIRREVARQIVGKLEEAHARLARPVSMDQSSHGE